MWIKLSSDKPADEISDQLVEKCWVEWGREKAQRKVIVATPNEH